MPITLVQHASGSARGAAAVSPGVVVSFASPPTIGNTIVVGVKNSFTTTGTLSLADNHGNTYKYIAGFTNGSASIWAADVAASSGTFTVTMTGWTANENVIMFINEFSGIAPYAVDVTAFTVGNVSTVNATVTTTGGTDLIFVCYGATNETNCNYVPTGGVALIDSLQNPHSGGQPPFGCQGATAWESASPAGSYTVGATYGPTGSSSSMCVVAFGGVAPSGPVFIGIIEEHYISTAKWTSAQHTAAMQDNAPLQTGSPATNTLILGCLMGNSPEIDTSGNGGNGSVTGTTLVPGH